MQIGFGDEERILRDRPCPRNPTWSGRVFAFEWAFNYSPTEKTKMVLLSNLTFIQTVAKFSTILFAVVIVLQIMLAVGILPVTIAWGGRQTQLTPALRIASLVAAVLLGAFIYVIRYRAGLLGGMPIPLFIKILSWVITALMVFNTLGCFLQAKMDPF